ncbi:MAG: hypothetical protein Q8O14_11910 [bacterium]|nr:hypothetical protein [bacterium]
MSRLETKLFVGLEITPKLQENLDSCKKAMELYFRLDNPDYLLVRRIGEKDCIGRIVPLPFPCQDLDNVQRNVVSLIKLIAPNFRLHPDSVQLFAYQEFQSEIRM